MSNTVTYDRHSDRMAANHGTEMERTAGTDRHRARPSAGGARVRKDERTQSERSGGLDCRRVLRTIAEAEPMADLARIAPTGRKVARPRVQRDQCILLPFPAVPPQPLMCLVEHFDLNGQRYMFIGERWRARDLPADYPYRMTQVADRPEECTCVRLVHEETGREFIPLFSDDPSGRPVSVPGRRPTGTPCMRHEDRSA